MAKAKKERTTIKKTSVPKVKKAAPKAAKPKAAILKPAKPKIAKLKPVKPALSKIKPPAAKERKEAAPVIHAVHKPVEAKIIPKIEPLTAVHPSLRPEVREAKKEVPKPAIKEAVREIKKEEFPVPEKHKVVEKPKDTVKPAAAEVKPEIKVALATLKELELELPINIKDLSIRLQEKPSVLIKFLMDNRVMVGINQPLDEAVVSRVCEKYGFKIKKAPGKEELVLGIHEKADDPKSLVARSPIVTFMGHVDHGKTSLLDAIRKTKVVEKEHGGITQHIGAYRVNLARGEITFLDTPGHEAFTAMRARGASITDIVVLVVAADDGIMPQTQEAIDHARAAGVPIIVAMNKIDKPQANPDMVKKQLQKAELTPEEWGGKTVTVPVSAKTGEGIDNLLEMILLEAELLELKANPNRIAKGVVIEAKMAKGRGPVVTLLVQNGTLHLNSNIVVGNLYGKIRAMFNDRGHSVTSAGPGFPVEVLGISGIPEAGEQFFVVESEKEAKEIVSVRQEKEKQEQIKTIKRISLEELHTQIQEGKIKELKVIIKADVQGSLEAIKDTINKLNVSEIKIDIIHTGVGNVNTSDVVLAAASNALILGFNIEADALAKELVAKEGIDLKNYNIIYELASDIKAAVEGMLEPKLKKIFLGKVEVRKVFKLSRSGTVAGCFVVKGKINRNAMINLVRNGAVVFEGKLSSLKRFKDDVREVAEGFECGITLAGFDQLVEGDIIEAFDIERIARKL